MIDWDFVISNANADPTKLRLKYLGRPELSPEVRNILAESITQIECRRRYTKKFPGLFDRHPRFTFPSQLAGEQASHLFVANLHASLALAESKEHGLEALSRPIKLFDMTAGLGLDFISMAEVLTKDGEGAFAVELDPGKAEVLKTNLIEVGLPGATVINGDSMEYLETLPDNSVGILFADPARRGKDDSRVYDPRDCQPDIVSHWGEILNKSSCAMIKNSPMLDLEQALRLFPHTEMLIVVSVKGECKEVLVIARKDVPFRGTLCVNICNTEAWPSDASIFTDAISKPDNFSSQLALWIPAEENPIPITYVNEIREGNYLYEPNASVMKARPWSTLLRMFPDLEKLSVDCHVFTSPILHPEFPGRILKVEKEIDRQGRKGLKGNKLNIISRAYPESPEQIARKLHVIPGGEYFLCALSLPTRPILLLAYPMA